MELEEEILFQTYGIKGYSNEENKEEKEEENVDSE